MKVNFPRSPQIDLAVSEAKNFTFKPDPNIGEYVTINPNNPQDLERAAASLGVSTRVLEALLQHQIYMVERLEEDLKDFAKWMVEIEAKLDGK